MYIYICIYIYTYGYIYIYIWISLDIPYSTIMCVELFTYDMLLDMNIAVYNKYVNMYIHVYIYMYIRKRLCEPFRYTWKSSTHTHQNHGTPSDSRSQPTILQPILGLFPTKTWHPWDATCTMECLGKKWKQETPRFFYEKTWGKYGVNVAQFPSNPMKGTILYQRGQRWCKS